MEEALPVAPPPLPTGAVLDYDSDRRDPSHVVVARFRWMAWLYAAVLALGLVSTAGSAMMFGTFVYVWMYLLVGAASLGLAVLAAIKHPKSDRPSMLAAVAWLVVAMSPLITLTANFVLQGGSVDNLQAEASFVMYFLVHLAATCMITLPLAAVAMWPTKVTIEWLLVPAIGLGVLALLDTAAADYLNRNNFGLVSGGSNFSQIDQWFVDIFVSPPANSLEFLAGVAMFAVFVVRRHGVSSGTIDAWQLTPRLAINASVIAWMVLVLGSGLTIAITLWNWITTAMPPPDILMYTVTERLKAAAQVMLAFVPFLVPIRQLTPAGAV